MPTTKPRHAVTETEPIKAALHDAARLWPDDSDRPTRLLTHLIEAGHEAIAPEAARKIQERRQAIKELLGTGTGLYPKGYLPELREDWPA